MNNWMRYYDASPDGKIRSLDREYVDSRGHRRKVIGRVLKTSEDRYGYEKVTLRFNGNCLYATVGRLVAEQNIPNPNDLPQVNHKNEKKLDNVSDNLEWCTAKYNSLYGSRPEKLAKARRRPIKVYDYEHNEECFESINEAAIILSLNPVNISACLNGRQSHTRGYTVCYDEEVVI